MLCSPMNLFHVRLREFKFNDNLDPSNDCNEESNKKDQSMSFKEIPRACSQAWLWTVHKLLCVCPEDHMSDSAFEF